MFQAPNIIQNIKEIKEVYQINEKQSDALRQAMQRVENNYFFDTMDKESLTRWERILKLSVSEKDTIAERRFRVKSKVFQKLPYSIRVIKQKLNSLCGESEYSLLIDYETESVYCRLHYLPSSLYDTIKQYLDDVVPLNMALELVEYIDSEFVEKITVEVNKLRLDSEFYPRHNCGYLFLNGGFWLDGTFYLNGTVEEKQADLYPCRLELKSKSKLRKKASTSVQLLEETSVFSKSQVRGTIKTDVECQFGLGDKLEQTSEVITQIGLKSSYLCKKDWWTLDGVTLLDGTRKMDAEERTGKL